MDSVTAMGPKINGNNIAELVKLEVEKTVNNQKSELLEMKSRFEAQLDRLHESLLARITCLESEINKYHQNTYDYKQSTSSSPSLPQRRARSTRLCRHWLQNRCTWRQQL